MTRKQLAAVEAAIKSFHKKHAATPEKAREALQAQGIITKTGRLTKHYRLAPTKKAAKAS